MTTVTSNRGKKEQAGGLTAYIRYIESYKQQVDRARPGSRA